MRVAAQHMRWIVTGSICLSIVSAVAGEAVSRDKAIVIATRYLAHYRNVRLMRCDAWLRWGDFADEPDQSIRLRLSHRKYWFVHFIPRNREAFCCGHSIYVAADTGEILGCSIDI